MSVTGEASPELHRQKIWESPKASGPALLVRLIGERLFANLAHGRRPRPGGRPSRPIYCIVRPLRDRGRRIPRFVWAASEEESPTGMLEVTWEKSEVHHRQMHVARLISGRATDVLPMIHDVQIIKLSSGDLTLAGFEQVEDREYAQTWFCPVLRKGWERRGNPEDPVGRSND